ncbi:Uu.00g049910.m01.CDS01 [Anthostomella pinea]|uniref:Mannan endo-1,6-alpha-mannosidase n=1 Tax=Anthostomella pinea TaxID=933095 RepID=A0AAI8VC33_9PEZI|nr:Uu.00g049910.m01.CDS01 [Anthostomella pinea]
MIYKSVHAAALAAAFTAPKDLDINDPVSIRSVASTLAYGTMAYYSGNVTDTPETIAIFPKPHYWWQAGAAWGAMLDYSHYTGDPSYDDVITEALLSQVGPAFDFMVPQHQGDEGNDDQAFWSFAILDAAERNFPQPDDSIPPWLDVATNIWNSMVVRWNDTACGGGLPWQIFESNTNGMDYKNSVSNGGFFQMSARLARATGNDTYVQWAQKVYDWSESVGFIDQNFNVFDGASSKENCSKINGVSFSYSQGIYMYGAAVLYNHTNGDKTWGDRTTGLLKAANSYFNPFPNATNIMYEHACEQVNTCNTDMLSFKGYLSRFMWATTRMMPSTLPDVQTLLNASAIAAGKACSGGDNGTVCGEKWYTGGYDGNPGLGQQMTALETVQGLLVTEALPPFRADQIKHVGGTENGTASTATPTASPVPTKRSISAGNILLADWRLNIGGLYLIVPLFGFA